MLRENIVKYIKEHGIKQDYVASNINISPHAMSAIVNGKREISAEEYVAICMLFNVSCDYFVSDATPA